MRKWWQLRKHDGGAVAPIVALSLFGLIAAGGLAFDYAHMAGLDSELQNAADQAALAAATQLDRQSDSITRATAAAQDLLTNQTLMGSGGPAVAITYPVVVFYATKADAEADINAVTDATLARFVRVAVAARQAKFALTPIVGILSSGDINAEAVAGLGSAICKTPPIMLCNPKPGTTFNASAYRGFGIQATGHGNDRSGNGAAVGAWAPGDFGFLDAGAGSNSDLVKALAFQSPPFKCSKAETGAVTTGNPQDLYDALNTRFDIYDMSSGNGTTLAPCSSGACPAAANTVKDLVKADTSTNGNSCKIHNSGWKLPASQFAPRPAVAADTPLTQIDSDGVVDAMGLPRDNCHYSSFGSACSGGRIGDGKWARGDYFQKYHAGQLPANPSTITRYETYLWEINRGGASRVPTGVAAGSGLNQYGLPVCSTGTINSGTDRRVLSLAVVENCAALNGNSQAVTISGWIDVFLVEPTIDARGNGSNKDTIYVEIIGNTSAAGNGSVQAQTLRRDTPYLVK